MSASTHHVDWIAEVKARADILQVAQLYTTLKPMGATFRGPCPLHQGKDPNFAVSPARNSFKCFVCDEGGTPTDLVMKMEGLDFLGAMKRLAALVGVEVPERRQRRRRSPTDLARAARQADLTATDPASTWSDLGLAEVAASFRLGVTMTAAGAQVSIPIFPPGADTPAGWCTYTVDAPRRELLPQGLDPASAPETAQLLFAPAAIRQHVRRQELVIVDDPAAVVLLAAMGHVAAVAPSVFGRSEGEPEALLSVEQATALASFNIRRATFLVPLGGAKAERIRRLRALFATEARLLAHGIEPLVVMPTAAVLADPERPEHRSSWAWLRALGSTDALRATLRDHQQTIDLFQARVEQLAAALAKDGARLTRAEAVEKLRPSLDAVLASGDRVLYHAYIAWAVRALGFRRRAELTGLLGRASSAADDAEVF